MQRRQTILQFIKKYYQYNLQLNSSQVIGNSLIKTQYKKRHPQIQFFRSKQYFFQAKQLQKKQITQHKQQLFYSKGNIYFRNHPFVIKTKNFHQEVFQDCIFGYPCFSQNCKKVLYVANIKTEKSKSYFQNGQGNLPYNHDLGELLSQITQVGLFLLDLQKQQLFRIQLQETIIPCYPKFVDKQGQNIIFGGYIKGERFVHGLFLCINRQSAIFYIEKIEMTKMNKKQKQKQKSQNKSTLRKLSKQYVGMFPNISPNYKKLIFFSSQKKLTHLHYMSMKMIDLSNEQNIIKQIIPIYQKEQKQSKKIGCVGLHTTFATQWIDQQRVIICTHNNGRISPFVININSKQIKCLNQKQQLSSANYIISYERQEKLLLLKSQNVIIDNQIRMPMFLRGYQFYQQGVKQLDIEHPVRMPLNDLIQQIQLLQPCQAYIWFINFTKLTAQVPSYLQQLWKFTKFNPLNSKRPIVLHLHGGPHSAILPQYTLIRNLLLYSGFIIIAPNYTGSIGFGQQKIQALLGKVGDIECKQIIQILQKTIKMLQFADPTNVFALGRSYGGYLASLFASKYSKYIRAAIQINPVLNFPYMMYSSDIPQWCAAQTLIKQYNYEISPDQCMQMFQKSSMNYKTQVPILLLMGQKDKRVPFQSSRLLNNSYINSRLFLYQQGQHYLTSPYQAMLDSTIKQIQFIYDNLYL